METTCISARDAVKAREVASAWQRKMEAEGKQVHVIPNPEQPRIAPFCVAGEEVLKEMEKPYSAGTHVAVDYSGLKAKQVIDALDLGLLTPVSVYAMEMDGNRRKGILEHLEKKFSWPPLEESPGEPGTPRPQSDTTSTTIPAETPIDLTLENI